jgi:hypothetical protein
MPDSPAFNPLTVPMGLYAEVFPIFAKSEKIRANKKKM